MKRYTTAAELNARIDRRWRAITLLTPIIGLAATAALAIYVSTI